MKKQLSAHVLRAALLLIAGAATFTYAGDSTPIWMNGTSSATGGADIYSHICEGCHMPNGRGAVGAGHYPRLAGDPALASWEYVALIILGGRNGMPAFGAPNPFASVYLSDAQVAEVVNYVRSSFGNNWKSSVTARQVAALPHPGVAAGN